MPNCSLCNKALDAPTEDGLCSPCQALTSEMQDQEAKTAAWNKKERHSLFLIAAFILAVIIIINAVTTWNDKRDIALAEQAVIARVEAESGQVPLTSASFWMRTPVSTVVLVSYAFRAEDLNEATSPRYLVDISAQGVVDLQRFDPTEPSITPTP